jgi:hypothetical protein
MSWRNWRGQRALSGEILERASAFDGGGPSAHLTTMRVSSSFSATSWTDSSQHVIPTQAGYVVSYLGTKNGDDHQRQLAHIGAVAECPPECPACALDDLLEWETTCMKRSSGPEVSTHYGGAIRHMTRQNGRLVVRAISGMIAKSPWGSTRSLRAGAATSAWEQGWPLELIASRITGHTATSARPRITSAGPGTRPIPCSFARRSATQFLPPFPRPTAQL